MENASHRTYAEAVFGQGGEPVSKVGALRTKKQRAYDLRLAGLARERVGYEAHSEGVVDWSDIDRLHYDAVATATSEQPASLASLRERRRRRPARKKKLTPADPYWDDPRREKERRVFERLGAARRPPQQAAGRQGRDKWFISVSGEKYAALQKRCYELGLSVSSVVESFVVELDGPGPTAADVAAQALAPRVAIDIPEWLLELVDDYRRRQARRGVEISRGDALERAILQAMENT